MPKPTKKKAPAAPPPAPPKPPEIRRIGKITLDLPQRLELLKMIESPVFRAALHNARLSKPSAFAGGLNGPMGEKIANNRLHEMRGWEMFETALFIQVQDPPAPRQLITESFPDAGLPFGSKL